MWALLPQPWTFTLVLKVGFSPDLQIRQKEKANPSFMVNLASSSSPCMVTRRAGPRVFKPGRDKARPEPTAAQATE